MEDLSPIYRFQPFVDTLKDARDTRIADVMREEFLKADQEVPAIQLAKLFLVHKVRQILITGTEGRLAGVVELRYFDAKLFWNKRERGSVCTRNPLPLPAVEDHLGRSPFCLPRRLLVASARHDRS